MKLQIGKNIEDVSKRILGDPAQGIPSNPTLANDIARAGIKAISSGIGPLENGVFKTTKAWKDLMLFFAAENTKELERLCGQDKDFNGSDWGLHCLAYIAGDSTCTSETTMRGGTKRSMLSVDEIADPPRRMLEVLDAESNDLERIDTEARAARAALNATDAEDLSDTGSSAADKQKDADG